MGDMPGQPTTSREETAEDSAAAFHPLLQAAFADLERAGVCWCLLRLPANPSAPRGDVDVLVERGDLGRLRSALTALGLVRFPSAGSRGEHVFLCYHAATDCWIRLHVVTELSFGAHQSLRSGAESTCLARRVHTGMLAALAPEEEFWATLLHGLLDKGDLAERHRPRLQALAGRYEPDGPLRPVVERSCPAGWNAPRIVECVRRGDWGPLTELAPALRSNWRRQSFFSRMMRSAGRWLRLPVRLLNLWRRRGLSVAVLGPDGAGKTTLAAGLAQSFFGPSRTIYMGFGVSGGDERQPLLARLSLPGLGAPGRLLVLWARVLSAWYHQIRGELVIFDRYSYDGLAPPPRRRHWLRRLSSWCKVHACPAPDAVILLDVPGSVMYARKGDLDPDTLEFQRQRFLSLRQRIPRLQIVDGTIDANPLRIDVTDRLWRLYASRFSGRG
jgi:thymidylate kinase